MKAKAPFKTNSTERSSLGRVGKSGIPIALLVTCWPAVALADGGIALLEGVWAMAIMLTLVSFLEAPVIGRGLGRTYFNALTVSFMLNGVSALMGIALMAIDGALDLIGMVGALILLFGLTVAVEGGLLVMVFRKASRRRLWVVALAMNLLSYFLVAGSLNLLHPSSYGMRALFTPAAEAPADLRPAELPPELKPEADPG